MRLTTAATVVLVVCLGVLSSPASGEDPVPRYLANPPEMMAAPSLGPEARAGRAALLQRYPQGVKKLRGRLLQLMDQRARFGQEQALAFAQAQDLPVKGETITVIAAPKAGIAPGELAAALSQRGSDVLRTGKRHVKVNVPLGLLQTLATDVDLLDHARLPIQPRLDNTVISEALGLTNADDWHARGLTGDGVKVAVIDGGFIGLAARQAENEIPASAIEVDYTGSGMESGTSHGCGVAEIVYDMAPDAQLYLIKIGDDSDLEAAGDYCITNGIHVINHSMGWYGFNFFDGVAYSSMVPSPVTVVNDAYATGVLWANSAGNDRQAHTLTCWVDDDGDDVMQWAPGVEINEIGYQIAGEVIVLHLTWNAWPTTDQDFDLYLVRWKGSSWAIVTGSENWQSGTQPPTEAIGYAVSNPGYYGVIVVKYSATTSPCFVLRSWYDDVYYYGYDNAATPAPGSIGCPADAASAMAVGAIDEDNYLTGPIEPYSAIGPTNGAYTGQTVLTKPDLCGPDDTASVTYAGGFTGTSASSPHAAGVAALVWEAFPNDTNAQVRNYLAVGGENPDLGSSGKDDIYGYGPLVLTDDFYSLTVTLKTPTDGTVATDPNQPDPNDPNQGSYVEGQQVVLTAIPNGSKQFVKWRIYDPNHPGDANYIAQDTNDVLCLTMDGDYGVVAKFKCSDGAAPLVPVVLGALGGLAIVRRRRWPDR